MTKKNSTNLIELDVRGMTCDSCALHVSRALQSVPGMEKAEVPGWESGRATIIAAPGLDTGPSAPPLPRPGTPPWFVPPTACLPRPEPSPLLKGSATST